MKCQKCKKDLSKIKWESGKTFEGLDRHHNPPEFMFRGEVPNGKYWKGEMLYLCRKHHVKLHKEIKKILHKHSNSIKFINSEYWLCQKMNDKQLKNARGEVYSFTKNWLKENDTKTT